MIITQYGRQDRKNTNASIETWPAGIRENTPYHWYNISCLESVNPMAYGHQRKQNWKLFI